MNRLIEIADDQGKIYQGGTNRRWAKRIDTVPPAVASNSTPAYISSAIEATEAG